MRAASVNVFLMCELEKMVVHTNVGMGMKMAGIYETFEYGPLEYDFEPYVFLTFEPFDYEFEPFEAHVQ